MDYLGGIVTKALGLAPVAEVRRLSRFEPRAVPAADDLQSLEQHDEIESEAPRSVRRAAPVESEIPPRRASAKAADPDFGEDRRASAPAPAETRRLRIDPPSERNEAPTSPITKDEQTESFAPNPRGSHEDLAPPRESRVEVSNQTTVRERVEKQTNTRSEITYKSLAEAQRRETSQSKSQLPEKLIQVSTPEPPDINISIGRIEVRASVTAPAPTPRLRTKEPQLGLDAYLKSRQGANR